MASHHQAWTWKYPHAVEATTAATAVARFFCLHWTRAQQQQQQQHRILPDSSRSQNIEKSILQYCTTKIPSTIGLLTNLKELEISNCPNLTMIPTGIGDLHSLEVLRIFGCIRLRDLPFSVLQLEQLRKLIVDYTICPALSRIVSTIPEEEGDNRGHQEEQNCSPAPPVGGRSSSSSSSSSEILLLPKLERFEVQRWRHVESNFPYQLFCGGGHHPNIEETLQELDLSDCDQFFRIVIQSVDRLYNLKKFRVCYVSSRWKKGCGYQRSFTINNDYEHTTKVAATKLKTLSKLETLSLEGVAEPEFLYHLFSYPWDGSAVLREIDLTDCNLGADGCVKILPGLPPSLAHLTLSGNTSLEKFLLGVVNSESTPSSLPRGVQSLSLERHPILDPSILSDSSLFRQRQILEKLLDTYPLLGRVSCPYVPLMTPELRYKLWSNRCGLHFLTHSYRLNQPSFVPRTTTDVLPLSVWPIVLERINRMYDSDVQSEHSNFHEQLLSLRHTSKDDMDQRIRLIQQNRIQVLYSFLQDFPIWMTS